MAHNTSFFKQGGGSRGISDLLRTNRLTKVAKWSPLDSIMKNIVVSALFFSLKLIVEEAGYNVVRTLGQPTL